MTVMFCDVRTCVGEFGIVYKAKQKKRFVDASWTCETVAVKTIKGWFGAFVEVMGHPVHPSLMMFMAL